MKNQKFIITAIGSSLCVCTTLVKAQSINVAFDYHLQYPATDTIALSAQGYDAADTSDSGTIWNQVWYEAGATAPSSPGQANTAGSAVPSGSANGTYTIYNDVSLVNSAGAASGAALSATLTQSSSDSHSEFSTGSTTAANSPGALMAQSARIYSGGDSITWVVSGLAVGSLYDLYLYGVGGANGAGANFTLASANDASSGIFTAETTDGGATYSATDNNIWDANGNVINGPGTDPNNIGNDAYGTSWVELNAVADLNGDVTFTESKEVSAGSGYGTGTDYLNGFQIQGVTAVPEPSTFALAGMGLLGLITLNYRRRRMGR